MQEATTLSPLAAQLLGLITTRAVDETTEVVIDFVGDEPPADVDQFLLNLAAESVDYFLLEAVLEELIDHVVVLEDGRRKLRIFSTYDYGAGGDTIVELRARLSPDYLAHIGKSH